jgi:hypothetical protein
MAVKRKSSLLTYDLTPFIGQGEELGTAKPEAGEASAEDYEQEVEVKPEQLAPHDMDVPEEPIRVRVQMRVWDGQQYVMRDLGEQLLVPTGCDRPKYLDPHKTKVTLKSALPRDLEKDSNLYALWQTNGWVSRRWVQDHLDEDINPTVVNKEIADDIPFLLALQGKQDPAGGVAQTNGTQPGDSNGAPLPPAPGPGRGNVYGAGDNLASGTPPPNGAPGTGV